MYVRFFANINRTVSHVTLTILKQLYNKSQIQNCYDIIRITELCPEQTIERRAQMYRSG